MTLPRTSRADRRREGLLPSGEDPLLRRTTAPPGRRPAARWRPPPHRRRPHRRARPAAGHRRAPSARRPRVRAARPGPAAGRAGAPPVVAPAAQRRAVPRPAPGPADSGPLTAAAPMSRRRAGWPPADQPRADGCAPMTRAVTAAAPVAGRSLPPAGRPDSAAPHGATAVGAADHRHAELGGRARPARPHADVTQRVSGLAPADSPGVRPRRAGRAGRGQVPRRRRPPPRRSGRAAGPPAASPGGRPRSAARTVDGPETARRAAAPSGGRPRSVAAPPPGWSGRPPRRRAKKSGRRGGADGAATRRADRGPRSRPPSRPTPPGRRLPRRLVQGLVAVVVVAVGVLGFWSFTSPRRRGDRRAEPRLTSTRRLPPAAAAPPVQESVRAAAEVAAAAGRPGARPGHRAQQHRRSPAWPATSATSLHRRGLGGHRAPAHVPGQGRRHHHRLLHRGRHGAAAGGRAAGRAVPRRLRPGAALLRRPRRAGARAWSSWPPGTGSPEPFRAEHRPSPAAVRRAHRIRAGPSPPGSRPALVVAAHHRPGGLPGLAVRCRPGRWPTTDVGTEDAMVPSGSGADAVELDTTLYVPGSATADDPAPAVLLAHGFGGSKDSVADDAGDLAERGYVVLTWSARGFGASTGQIGLDDPRYEVADVSTLLDRAGRPGRRATSTRPATPGSGVAGGSYGGALALLAAAYDDRVDAIAPQITWNSLTTALFPDQAGIDVADAASRRPPRSTGAAGVFKRLWAGLFFGVGSVPTGDGVLGGLTGGGGAGATVPDLSGRRPGHGDPGADLRPVPGRHLRGLPVRGVDRHAHARGRRRAGPQQPGRRCWTGSPPRPCWCRARRTRCSAWARPTPTPAASPRTAPTVRVVWYDGGHDTSASDAVTGEVRDEVAGWFDRYLRGTGPAPGGGFSYPAPTGLGTGHRHRAGRHPDRRGRRLPGPGRRRPGATAPPSRSPVRRSRWSPRPAAAPPRCRPCPGWAG